jgi:hypothetical protein
MALNPRQTIDHSSQRLFAVNVSMDVGMGMVRTRIWSWDRTVRFRGLTVRGVEQLFRGVRVIGNGWVRRGGEGLGLRNFRSCHEIRQ